MTTTTVSLDLPMAPVARREAIRAAGARMQQLRAAVDDPAATSEARTAARAALDQFLTGLRAALRARPSYTLRWTTSTGPRSYTSTSTSEIEVRGKFVARLEREGRATDIEVVVDGSGMDVTWDFDCFRE